MKNRNAFASWSLFQKIYFFNEYHIGKNLIKIAWIKESGSHPLEKMAEQTLYALMIERVGWLYSNPSFRCLSYQHDCTHVCQPEGSAGSLTALSDQVPIYI